MGGVAANSELRRALPEAALAPLALCTDNAAMIASAARYHGSRPVPGVPFARCTCLGVAPLKLLVVAMLTVVLVATVSARGRDGSATRSTVSWRGLVGEPRAAVPIGQRSIVVLHTPSVAQRLAKVKYATEAQERSWTNQAFAAQQQVLTTLAAQGIAVRREYSYARVLDGFSAALDPRAVALLEQMPEIAGVYPVRAAFPASASETLLSSSRFGPTSGHRAVAELPGYDGRGVTIALLDTGVDQAHPYLRGKILPGIDLVDRNGDAAARSNPLDPAQVERHGTEMAGILVGAGGPRGLHGVAPGATVLPLRIAGWQPAADGRQLVYGRSDQLIAGLDRAVDPNGDGDAHDAVRVALIGVAEPYAAFTDGPEARAVQGALDLNTLVVAPAGNDGDAGPSFGSIAGPAGGAGALAVGATDARSVVPRVRVVLRRGLDVIFDQRVPLLGAVAPAIRRRCGSRRRVRRRGSPVSRAPTSSTARASASWRGGPSWLRSAPTRRRLRSQRRVQAQRQSSSTATGYRPAR